MATSSESQFVTFSLGEEIIAVPVEVVREILDHEDAFKIPHGPDYLLGLRDVRGQGVPIIDLRIRLGMPATVTLENQARDMRQDRHAIPLKRKRRRRCRPHA